MIFIYIPFQNIETAKKVARILVENKMAGSIDILPSSSFFRENDQVVEGERAIMIVKTIDKHIQNIEDVVRDYYQDGIPCIASITLYRLNRDFKNWLVEATN